jgi:hypothetical protein
MQDPIYGPFITRKEALAKGLKQYYPGSLCPKGHLAPRFTSGGRCIVCQKELMEQKRAEGYFREYEARRREIDPSWRANKARVARESYHRHKNSDAAKEKRKAWYEKNKDSDWYQESTKRAKARFSASGKKAESDKRYALSESGKRSHEKARNEWRKRFEAEKGMPVSTWRLKNDPQFKLHSRLNTRISDALKRQGIAKAAKTEDLIDAPIADFKSYLAANWEEGMSWENYGKGGWHVDHIRPCASFDLTDEAQQRVCFNWRNLRPMWGAENIGKSDNYDAQDEEYWIEMMLELGYEGDLFPLFLKN